MAMNINSLQAKLLNVSKEKGIEFQLFLNRFAGEQFLERLSQSALVGKFVFKGGSLLTYLIDTGRKTRDLDFSVKQMSHEVADLRKIIQSILEIPLEDGITWDPVKGTVLNHPTMPYPGARIICSFHLGQMKGQVRMDLAFGDRLEPAKMMLPKIRYNGKPLVGKDFSLFTYPPETVFSEKLQIALARKEGNTRMRDYYDLFKLSHSLIDLKKLKQAIHVTFMNRKMELCDQIPFDSSIVEKLQIYWSHYRTKEKLKDAPENISEIIERINSLLRQVFVNE